MSRFRSPVKRQGAEHYLLVTLVISAATVVLVRLYLELTGYPQIGNGVLHIAHVLWGGLLLFVAALLMILVANRWVYRLGAVLGGIGAGLFIDEVGKFITRSNDYFFPFAAPIIYAFFLIVLLIYLEVRRPSQQDSRHELYHALDQIMELIENDLDARERADLDTRLQNVIAAPEFPEHARLAEALLAVIDSDTLTVASPNRLQRWLARAQDMEKRILTQPRYRTLIVLGLVTAGIGSLLELIFYAAVLIGPNPLDSLAVSLQFNGQIIDSPTSLIWFAVLVALSGLTGVMMLAGGALLFVKRERAGSALSYLGLIVSLTTVNLLLFYFNQFASVSTTIWEAILFIALMHYRQLYLGIGIRSSVFRGLSDPSITPESAFSE